MDNLKARFNRTFANLPLGVRNETVLVLDGQPMTWHVIKLEVDADSKFSIKALKILDELKLLRE